MCTVAKGRVKSSVWQRREWLGGTAPSPVKSQEHHAECDFESFRGVGCRLKSAILEVRILLAAEPLLLGKVPF